MLWVYGHYKLINSLTHSVMETDFRRRILMSIIDPSFERVKPIILKLNDSNLHPNVKHQLIG